jgi:hypothetical protein
VGSLGWIELRLSRFVATLLHPAFVTNNAERNITVRYDPVTGEQEIIRGRFIKEYMSVPPAMGIAIPGQPEKQVSFSGVRLILR